MNTTEKDEELRQLVHRASNFLTVCITQAQVGLASEGEEAKKSALECILKSADEWTGEVQMLKRRLMEE